MYDCMTVCVGMLPFAHVQLYNDAHSLSNLHILTPILHPVHAGIGSLVTPNRNKRALKADVHKYMSASQRRGFVFHSIPTWVGFY